MKRNIALLAGVLVFQGCLAVGIMDSYGRQTEARKQLAVTKMQDGLRQFKHGQLMVITGVTLNNQLAV